ncbi:pyridoxal-dependent decarboxylase [Streptomyces sp. MS1.AVA.1]|uniref:Pyridoxal-dependent decarboxylase n=1 Tax=Streptomyces machairae TaxID=3134109 RepID=A0ABU8UF76_9ACTN
MDELTKILKHAAEHAATYRRSLPERPVARPVDYEALRAAFSRPLDRSPADPLTVVDELVAVAETGLVATAGPRFFGFVVGGALPAATAAEILAAGWDQNAFNAALSPAALAAEEAAGGWLKDLLGIPATASTGFVTGGQAANTAGLAAARHHLLTEAGWDVGRKGLGGAPRLRVVAGEERHATIDRSLRLLGLGTDCLEMVLTNGRGALDTDDLRRVLASDPGTPAIVCTQAGNVNTGACDDLRTACDLTHAHGGWVHVDGAFGLWAAASPATRHLVDGVELADSWACDGHKWLNVPTTAATPSVPAPPSTPTPCRTPPPTSPALTALRPVAPTTPPSPPATHEASPPGQRCANSAVTASPNWWTAAAPSPAASPKACPRRALRWSTT